MSLTTNGVWAANVWASTVWADCVWYEPSCDVAATPTGGGKGRRRYQFVVIDDRQILVNSPQEAAMLLSKARKAKQKARREAKKERRHLIKLKKPDATTGAIDWNAKQEAELKALLQEMYDEEEALVALLCLH